MSDVIRVNFDDSTSKHLHWKTGPGFPEWIHAILREFQQAYDSTFTETNARYLLSPKGVKYIVAWLKSQGYKAEYWEMDFNDKPKDEPYILAYGIEFQTNCEQLIKLKLKSIP